jgi:hypothetical protein
MSRADVAHTIAELTSAGEALASHAQFVLDVAGDIPDDADAETIEHAAEGLRAYAGRVVQLAFAVADGAGRLAGAAAACPAAEGEVQS